MSMVFSNATDENHWQHMMTEKEKLEQLISLLDEHPNWSGAAIKKQFLYLTQKASKQ